jgi:outer membrane protein assembly factor BamC
MRRLRSRDMTVRAARPFTLAVGLAIAAAAGGCTSVSNARLIDYRSARQLPALEVPPDLSASAVHGSDAASGTATYSGYAGKQEARAGANETVLPQYPNVRLVRDGQTRYIVVKAEPSAVWNDVRDFLAKTGLSIAHEDPKAGLMETDWAENHAAVGASEGSNLAKWFKSFFSTGVRDKYRVRLERGVEPGTTEIYLTHAGMQEVQADESINRDPQAGWRPRPPDPELEAEMLHRLVVYLGGNPAEETMTAKAPAAGGSPKSAAPASNAPPSAKLTRDGNGAALLTLEDSLERAWRRVGLSLDRIGFTVEDRDRSKGIYYVRYIDPDLQKNKKGFFSRWFGGDHPAPSNQYQVQVRPADNGTNVEVLDKQGDPETSKTGERILSLLYEQLK